MYIHGGAKLAFLANPRTASRAVKEALKLLGFELRGSHHSGFARSHMDPSRYKTFTTVRHHADALVSWACHLNVDPLAPCWLEDVLEKLPRQHGLIEPWGPGQLFPWAHHADVILRFEGLEAQLASLVFDHLGVVPLELEHVGRSAERPVAWRDLYDPVQLELVRGAFGAEMELLGYSLEEAP